MITTQGKERLIRDAQETARHAIAFARDGWTKYAREKAILSAHVARQAIREIGATYKPCVRCLDFARAAEVFHFSRDWQIRTCGAIGGRVTGNRAGVTCSGCMAVLQDRDAVIR